MSSIQLLLQSSVIMRMKYFVRKWQHFRINMVVNPPYSNNHHKYFDNHHDDWFAQPQPQLIGMDCDSPYHHHHHHHHDHQQNRDIITTTTTTTSTPQQQQLLDQLSLWFAVPKQKISRQKKRMKTTRQRRIPLKKNIITDPRTGEVTLRHRLPFNWKNYLPHALLNNNNSNNNNSNSNNSNNNSSASTTN
jgi:ribosomal protein L32